MHLRSLRTFLFISIGALSAATMLAGSTQAGGGKEPLWYPVATIDRVQKPNRQPVRHLPPKQRAPLLTLQWHLIERGDGNTKVDADPSATFQNEDQLRLAITTNQPGFLYVISQPPTNDALILFPDPQVNGGQNRVKANEDYIVPAYCPGFEDPKDCWWTMKPPAGTEKLLIIFSREKITTLPNQVIKAGGRVKREVVEELIASSGKKVEQFTGELALPNRAPVRFATRVQNTNPKDNEELIATVELKHGE